MTTNEVKAIHILEQARPISLRTYDQIPMNSQDLLEQAKRVAPQLAGKSIAFIGDHDGTSLMLGLLAHSGILDLPKKILLLDFDERLLAVAQLLAAKYGFAEILETRLYNVFDKLPEDLVSQYDGFYTNPPYGASNDGASVRLFITRGFELLNSNGIGYAIIPKSQKRSWTLAAYRKTKDFLSEYGWQIVSKIENLHGYKLDDDPTLRSAFIKLEKSNPGKVDSQMPWAGRDVTHIEIPNFYGRSVEPPYPNFISRDGYEVFKPDIILSEKVNHEPTSSLDFSSQPEQVQYPSIAAD